jgi:hypothetical protein
VAANPQPSCRNSRCVARPHRTVRLGLPPSESSSREPRDSQGDREIGSRARRERILSFGRPKDKIFPPRAREHRKEIATPFSRAATKMSAPVLKSPLARSRAEYFLSRSSESENASRPSHDSRSPDLPVNSRTRRGRSADRPEDGPAWRSTGLARSRHGSFCDSGCGVAATHSTPLATEDDHHVGFFGQKEAE